MDHYNIESDFDIDDLDRNLNPDHNLNVYHSYFTNETLENDKEYDANDYQESNQMLIDNLQANDTSEAHFYYEFTLCQSDTIESLGPQLISSYNNSLVGTSGQVNYFHIEPQYQHHYTDSQNDKINLPNYYNRDNFAQVRPPSQQSSTSASSFQSDSMSSGDMQCLKNPLSLNKQNSSNVSSPSVGSQAIFPSDSLTCISSSKNISCDPIQQESNQYQIIYNNSLTNNNNINQGNTNSSINNNFYGNTNQYGLYGRCLNNVVQTFYNINQHITDSATSNSFDINNQNNLNFSSSNTNNDCNNHISSSIINIEASKSIYNTCQITAHKQNQNEIVSVISSITSKPNSGKGKEKGNLNKGKGNTNKGKPKPKCPKCNIDINRQQDLNRHLITVHDKLKPYKCERCHKYFGRNDALNRHKKSCSECQKND